MQQRAPSGLSKYAGNAKIILKLDKEGKVAARFPSVESAASAAGVDKSTIRRWTRDEHLHRGYSYVFAKEERKTFTMPLREKAGVESYRRKPYLGLYGKGSPGQQDSGREETG